MYNIIKELKPNTFLAEKNDDRFILKKISEEDVSLYQKLLKTNSYFLAKVIEIVNIDEYLYAVSDYIQGKTLDEIITEKGYLDELTAIHYAVDICNGLKELQKHKIVHRDINPNNIIVRRDGSCAIIDYGISRIVKSEKEKDTVVLGTVGFTSPEQYGFEQTTNKSDIFSVGMLIKYMLTNDLTAKNFENTRIDKVVKKCTAFNPDKRFKNFDELIISLQFCISGKKFENVKFRSTLLEITYLIFAVFISLLSFLIEEMSASDHFILFVVMIFSLIIPECIAIFYNSKNFINYYLTDVKKRKVITIISTVSCLLLANVLFLIIFI